VSNTKKGEANRDLEVIVPVARGKAELKKKSGEAPVVAKVVLALLKAKRNEGHLGLIRNPEATAASVRKRPQVPRKKKPLKLRLSQSKKQGGYCLLLGLKKRPNKKTKSVNQRNEKRPSSRSLWDL
jgi:hypothetical protein